MCLVNGRPGTLRRSSAQGKPILCDDPWIRRCDQPLPIGYTFNQEHEKEAKPIQYETCLYYRSLSTESDDHMLHPQRQPLLSNIDKDIEYVESRLRGQTPVSCLKPHSTCYMHDVSWQQLPKQNCMDASLSFSNDQQQQTHVAHQKYSDKTNAQQINGRIIPRSKSLSRLSSMSSSEKTHGNKRAGKNRIEKVKDQKAAKTLR